MTTRAKCVCGKQMIEPIGPKASPVLLVGTYPGTEEIIKGIPFCGPAGVVLRAELARAGIPMGNCRVTNLWTHAKDEKDCSLDLHMNLLAKELKGRKYALLMGSDLSKALFDCGIMEISGLEMKHELFPNVRLFMSPNPADAMREPVGELRLAISRFAEVIKWEQ